MGVINFWNEKMFHKGKKDNSAVPILFQKRAPLTGRIAAQYIGTDMEMDPKEGYGKDPGPTQPLIGL